MVVSVLLLRGLAVLILTRCFPVELNTSSVTMSPVLVLAFLLPCNSILVLKFRTNLNSPTVGWVRTFSPPATLIARPMATAHAPLVHDGAIGCPHCVSGSSSLAVS